MEGQLSNCVTTDKNERYFIYLFIYFIYLFIFFLLDGWSLRRGPRQFSLSIATFQDKKRGSENISIQWVGNLDGFIYLMEGQL